MGKNLDATLNELAYSIVEEISRLENPYKKQHLGNIDKSLGVLVNDGVYAYYLFWKAQKSKSGEVQKTIRTAFINKVVESLSNYVAINFQGKKDDQKWEDYFEEYFRALSIDLRNLLYFREMLEKVLIYARYHAKAKGDQ